MITIKTETFLFEYFLFDSMFGEYTDRKKIFYCLGDLWGVEQKTLKGLFAIAESENVREISTVNEYMRYMRIKQYNELIGNQSIYSEQENAMIAIKGEAMKIVAQYEMQATSETTLSVMHKMLLRNAHGGNVVALRVLGLMQCEGVIEKKDISSGLKKLKKAASWGDITSILAVPVSYCVIDLSAIPNTSRNQCSLSS